jgi:hypothetical protein
MTRPYEKPEHPNQHSPRGDARRVEPGALIPAHAKCAPRITAGGAATVWWTVAEDRTEIPCANGAEWEYAARAGTRMPFWWGREVGTGHAQCDGGNPIEQQVVPPARSGQTASGSTTGNAAEWVEDCRTDFYRMPAEGCIAPDRSQLCRACPAPYQR